MCSSDSLPSRKHTYFLIYICGVWTSDIYLLHDVVATLSVFAGKDPACAPMLKSLVARMNCNGAWIPTTSTTSFADCACWSREIVVSPTMIDLRSRLCTAFYGCSCTTWRSNWFTCAVRGLQLYIQAGCSVRCSRLPLGSKRSLKNLLKIVSDWCNDLALHMKQSHVRSVLKVHT